MKDVKKLIESLHPLERKVFPLLLKYKSLKELIEKSGLSQVEVMRALQWLENKGIIKLKVKEKEIVTLDNNGKKYIQKGLPEKRVLIAVKGKPLNLNDVLKKAGIDRQELNVSIGLLKSKAAIDFQDRLIKMTEQGKKLLAKSSLEENFLIKLAKGEVKVSQLTPEEKFAYDIFRKRKNIIKTALIKERIAELTDIGKKLSAKKLEANVSDRLTPKMLADGTWKNRKFRRYDTTINVPEISGGKKHFVNQSIEYAKKIWLEMGFTEMQGPMIDSSFWVFDALFTAQDHPVREMQDTFFVKDPSDAKLPEKKIVEGIKKSHETGTKGSKGWQYKWDEKTAKKLVLRTHTTSLSARTIATLKDLRVPGKYFAVGRCFRNETMDWSHLFEFNQTEGIVIDPDASFKHLLGYLQQFFRKMGFPKARFRPAFFSYTEPSVEIDVYHPVHKKWIELGGAGVFRPEVVEPLLGKDVPVLAWGPGFDRIILEYYNITDIRDLYKNDLKQIREIKAWMR